MRYGTELCEKEKTFIEKRKKSVFNAMREFLGEHRGPQTVEEVNDWPRSHTVLRRASLLCRDLWKLWWSTVYVTEITVVNVWLLGAQCSYSRFWRWVSGNGFAEWCVLCFERQGGNGLRYVCSWTFRFCLVPFHIVFTSRLAEYSSSASAWTTERKYQR